MTNDQELKPCPFCDATGAESKWQNGGYRGQCRSRDCDAKGPWAETETEADAAWNRRAGVPNEARDYDDSPSEHALAERAWKRYLGVPDAK